MRSLSQLPRLYGAPPLPGRYLVLLDVGKSEPLLARAHGHASEGQFPWPGVVRRVVMGLPRALALGCRAINLPDRGSIVVSSKQHCRASRAASGHLYGLVEWKMLSASLASSFHLEFGRLVPLLDASPPMLRVWFALRCARAWERAQRSERRGYSSSAALVGEGTSGPDSAISHFNIFLFRQSVGINADSPGTTQISTEQPARRWPAPGPTTGLAFRVVHASLITSRRKKTYR